MHSFFIRVSLSLTLVLFYDNRAYIVLLTNRFNFHIDPVQQRNMSEMSRVLHFLTVNNTW